jgi:serine/threonine-protein kinase
VLAKRYRIVGLLGRGGMGEVYRAEDLKLGQSVALKFLPKAVQRNAARLNRFLNEVRVALKVSHPNVCRVHDIGEVDPSTGSGQAQHFLSMEYVDGEDLASLLRRIGRLPQHKAIQIARQLCAGLAAAHEQGILHRDLKPANVMIDGRGHAKIADFGLANLAEGVRADEVRAGTPSYMAPEQLAGREVSVRSDLYSLGLVLYELFTGKQAFEAQTRDEMARLQRESTPSDPSSHVQGLDPAVERVILQCLENEPADRPASALAVAAALPGGDPLAAALAAGETPSPEMVAAAGPRGGLRPGVATVCLALVMVGLVLSAIFVQQYLVLGRVTEAKSFEALKDDANEIAVKLGYTEKPRDRYAAFRLNLPEYRYLMKEHVPGDDWNALGQPGQTALWFFYRQSPRLLVPSSLGGAVTRRTPPNTTGDLWMYLDLRGNLVQFEATPMTVEWSDEPAPPLDWSILFEAAGLDIEDYEPTEPTVQPAVYVDVRAAWTGVLPDRGDCPVRIEAAACRGKPVYFDLVVPAKSYWEEPADHEADDATQPFETLGLTVLGIFVLLIAVIVFLAVRNLKLGRGDRKGALRLAGAILVLRLLQWLFTGHHVPDFEETSLFIIALSGALSLGLFTWLLYIALEPYLRRVWPKAIVAWNRLLAGRFRDPLVGRDILLGFAISGVTAILFAPISALARLNEWLPPASQAPLSAMRGGRFALGEIFSTLLNPLTLSLLVVALFMVFRIVLRRTWIAAIAFGALFAGQVAFAWLAMTGGEMAREAVYLVIYFAVIGSVINVFLLIRFGLLAFIAYSICDVASQAYFPFTIDTSAPYFASGLVGPLMILGLAIYAFRISLAGRPLFKDEVQSSPG